MNRREFVKSAACACGITGAGLFSIQGAVVATPAMTGPNIIGPEEGFSPQIGTLVSMLGWIRRALMEAVQGLGMAELDYLHDPTANTIGALLLHLAATERHYQAHTFDGRKWGDWDNDTRRQWDVPAGLGVEARRVIKGREVSFYVDSLTHMREQTLSELRKRDDAWLMQVDRDFVWGPTNNYCKWFHVCEHEAHHKGQIAWIKGRLGGAKQTRE